MNADRQQRCQRRIVSFHSQPAGAADGVACCRSPVDDLRRSPTIVIVAVARVHLRPVRYFASTRCHLHSLTHPPSHRQNDALQKLSPISHRHRLHGTCGQKTVPSRKATSREPYAVESPCDVMSKCLQPTGLSKLTIFCLSTRLEHQIPNFGFSNRPCLFSHGVFQLGTRYRE